MRGLSSTSGALLAPDPEEANEGRDEPKKRREEGEGDDGLELPAGVAAEGDVGPGEGSAAEGTVKLLKHISAQSPAIAV